VHELSIALEICRVVEERIPAAQLHQLAEVGLDIGERATMEVANLQFCLDTLLAHSPFAGADVVIARTDGEDTRVSYLEIDDER